MTKVSAGQMRVLAFVSEYIQKHKYAPTIREIADGTGYKSTSSVQVYILALVAAGLLETDHPGSPRALRLSAKYIIDPARPALDGDETEKNRLHGPAM